MRWCVIEVLSGWLYILQIPRRRDAREWETRRGESNIIFVLANLFLLYLSGSEHSDSSYDTLGHARPGRAGLTDWRLDEQIDDCQLLGCSFSLTVSKTIGSECQLKSASYTYALNAAKERGIVVEWRSFSLSVLSPQCLGLSVYLPVGPSVRPVWGVNVFFCYFVIITYIYSRIIYYCFVIWFRFAHILAAGVFSASILWPSTSQPAYQLSVRPAVRRQLVFILSMGFWIRNCLGFGCSFYRPRGFFQYYFYF